MPEGVTPYPRWHGQLQAGERWAAVAAHEVRLAFRGTWSRLALLAGIVWGISSIIELYQFKQAGETVHELDWFIDMIRQLRWAALAVAAAVGGPAIMDDARRGALELYMTRSLTHRGYLLGKALALMALTTLTILIPAILYYGSVYIFFDDHPARWAWAWLGATGYAVMWGLLVSGLALGLSAVGRSSRAAALILLGAFLGLEIVVGDLLSGLTEEPALAVLSPFDAMHQQVVYLFDLEPPFEFPAWWGLAMWAGLTVAGWALLAWRHPRVRGGEA